MRLYVCGVFICQLVEQFDGDLSCERPWQVVIIPSFHEVSVQWDMSACTFIIPIGIDSKTYLVTFRAGVEWRTAPLLFEGFVLVVLWHFECTWTSCNIVTGDLKDHSKVLQHHIHYWYRGPQALEICQDGWWWYHSIFQFYSSEGIGTHDLDTLSWDDCV